MYVCAAKDLYSAAMPKACRQAVLASLMEEGADTYRDSTQAGLASIWSTSTLVVLLECCWYLQIFVVCSSAYRQHLIATALLIRSLDSPLQTLLEVMAPALNSLDARATRFARTHEYEEAAVVSSQKIQ